MEAHLSAKPVLDTRRIKTDNSYPIKLRVIVFRKTIHLKTNYTAKVSDWSDKDSGLKKSWGHNYQAINHKLKLESVKIQDELLKQISKEKLHSGLSAKEIKRFLVGGTSGNTLAFFDFYIDKLNQKNKTGTARWYNQAKVSVKSFVSKDFPLQEINPHWLRRYSDYYLEKNTSKNAINGLSVYLRAIRAILNKAKEEGVLDPSHNPFREFKIKTQKTEKRALTKEDFKKIITAECEEGWQKRARDIFLFLYLSYGMSFRDMAKLKLKNIISGRIEYSRAKTEATGKIISVKVTPSIEKILRNFIEGKKKNEFIFGIIKNDQTEKQQYYSIKNAMKRCNTALKEIALKAGIEENLTTYTARHSFASHLLENGNSIELISQMMGHENIRTTQIYVKGFNKDALDEAQLGLVGI